jgi:Ca2+-binding EF-hand superfamily protein
MIFKEKTMKNFGSINSLLLFMFSIILTFPAFANSYENFIKKLDADGDGVISVKEAVADPALLAAFGKIDKDGNGKLSLQELLNTKVIIIDKAITK